MSYVLFERQIIPQKCEMPDIKNIYMAGSVHDPFYTESLTFAHKFSEIEKAKEWADILGLHVGKLVIEVERV